MHRDTLSAINLLDKIRINNGIDNLKVFFHELVKSNTEEAINLVNHENLHFASLFVLKPEMEVLNLFHSLNVRNKISIGITSEILTSEKNISISKYFSSHYIQAVYSVLKWMVETGFIDDGLSNEYDEVLDICAILLTKVYRDKTTLPIIGDTIFKRYKKGLLIHDLVWAFFECRDPHSLIIIADHLQSKELKEVQLARKLLNFVPGIAIKNNALNIDEYLSFLNWIGKNNLFLAFTGESFQQSSNPVPYIVVLEAKYLCAAVSVDTGKILKTLTEEECKLLEQFKKLDDNSKILLSNFSFIMHQKNIYTWHTWIHYPMAEQIKIAKLGGVQ